MLKKIVPKSQRTKRILDDKAPKLVENVKKSLELKGANSSQIINDTLKDFHLMKKPDSKLFSRKNDTRPFEDQSSLEFLCRQNDCSLFAFGSHSKKRPDNLVLGRLFDFQVLDMFEFGIDRDTFKSMRELEGKRKATIHVGSKPCFVFHGEEFDTNPDFVAFKSLIVDYFRGAVLDKINLAGLDRVMVLTAHGDKVYFRHYAIALKKSGTKLPRVELEEVGPHMDLTFRRRKSAAPEVQKMALRQRKATSDQPKKIKNIERGAMGDKAGRIHMEKQDLSKIAIAKRKGLKRPKEAMAPDSAPAAAANGDHMDIDDFPAVAAAPATEASDEAPRKKRR